MLAQRGNGGGVQARIVGAGLGRVTWQDSEEKEGVSPVQPLNLILYGPPGTGKTYETASLAVRISIVP